jgi:hypothetical protein
MIKHPQKRRPIFWLLIPLLFGFALRVHALNVPELNIDEAWTYLNSYFLAYPSGYSVTQILAPEPNNALHLLLSAGAVRLIPEPFAVRFLSMCVSVITLALLSRLAFRLYGRRAALIAIWLGAFAFLPVAFAQIARGYSLAALLGMSALLFFLERKWRREMLFGALTPLVHLGAFPIVMIGDALTLWRVIRHRYVNIPRWIVRSVVVYGMALLVVYMTFIRRDIHVISSGQLPPTLSGVFEHLLGTVINPGLPFWLRLIMIAILIVSLIVALRWRVRLQVPVLWIVLTYSMLVTLAILADGPIKWLHIHHVVYALVLIMAAGIALMPRRLQITLVALFVTVSAWGLMQYYGEPYRYWREARAAMNTANDEQLPVYLGQPTVIYVFAVNADGDLSFAELPPLEQRPERFGYVEIIGWHPPPPIECDEQLWTDGYLVLWVCVTD